MANLTELTVLYTVLSYKYWMERKICTICNKYPVAINYYREEKVYYRSACTPCIHQKRKPRQPVPAWIKSGYVKPDRCEKCNFKFRLVNQSRVFHIDGNIANCHWANLRTICLNCALEVSKTNWIQADLQPDF